MPRAPRRHPAAKALADLRTWKTRWPATVPEEEHIIAVEAWLLRTAKVPPVRRSRTPTAIIAKAPTLPKRKAAKPAAAKPAKVATKAPPSAKMTRIDARRPSARKPGPIAARGQYTGPAADGGGLSPD